MASDFTVDADAPGTWPSDLADFVSTLADSQRRHLNEDSDFGTLTDAKEVAGDSTLDDSEPRLRKLLEGKWLRVHHATRLLPSDVTSIREAGLLRPTRERTFARQDRALEAGEIDAAAHAWLRESTVFASSKPPGAVRRDSEVCVVPTRRPFTDRLFPQFDRWGGEIHYALEPAWKEPRMRKLSKLGEPYLVTGLIDASNADTAGTAGTPGLAYTFVGTTLGLKQVGGTIHYRGDIPSAQIESVTRWS